MQVERMTVARSSRDCQKEGRMGVDRKRRKEVLADLYSNSNRRPNLPNLINLEWNDESDPRLELEFESTIQDARNVGDRPERYASRRPEARDR